MLISHKFKFLSICIPKTATKSLRHTLSQYIDITGNPNAKNKETFYQHEIAKSAKQKFIERQWDWNDYFKYTIIRNPWARYASLYTWSQHTYEEFKKLPYESLNPIHKHHLSTFDAMYNKDSKLDNVAILKRIINSNQSQDEFYLIDNQIAVNYIGRMENIDRDFLHICKMVNIDTPPKLKYENKSYAYSYKDLYNQELVDLVAQKEKYTIDHYGYQY